MTEMKEKPIEMFNKRKGTLSNFQCKDTFIWDDDINKTIVRNVYF